jgi:DNA replication protein DnaC
MTERPEPWVCAVCGHEQPATPIEYDTGWAEWQDDFGCPVCARRKLGAELREELRLNTLQRYGMLDGEYAEMTLASYRVDPTFPSQAEAIRRIRKRIGQWRAGDWSQGLWIHGPYGIGKTHLGIAAAREGIQVFEPLEQDGTLFAVYTVPDLLSRIKASWNKPEVHGTEKEIIDQVVKPVLLMLDDLGAEHTTVNGKSWFSEIMFKIVNARWLKRRAMIVTTNLSVKELRKLLGDRVMSRLIELIGKPIPLDGVDMRASRSIQREE